MPRSNFFRLGLKVAKSGFRTIGKKLSAADGLYKKYGSKVASVAKMLLPGYADKIDRAQSAISSAQQAGKAIKEGDVVAGKYSVNRAAFAIHSQIHAARPEAAAAAHAHTVNGKAFSIPRS